MSANEWSSLKLQMYNSLPSFIVNFISKYYHNTSNQELQKGLLEHKLAYSSGMILT